MAKKESKYKGIIGSELRPGFVFNMLSEDNSKLYGKPLIILEEDEMEDNFRMYTTLEISDTLANIFSYPKNKYLTPYLKIFPKRASDLEEDREVYSFFDKKESSKLSKIIYKSQSMLQTKGTLKSWNINRLYFSPNQLILQRN